MSGGIGGRLLGHTDANDRLAKADTGRGPKSSAALGTVPPASAVYKTAAARVSDRFGYFQILMARNALTYEGWQGASGWNNVHQ